MAGDWEVGVSGLLLHRMLMLFEDQESSGDVLEALQAASEGCRAGLAVALAAKKTSELSGEACDFAQVEWRGGQQLMGTFKGQQRLPLVLFKSNATRLQWTSAREFLDVFDSPSHHQVNGQRRIVFGRAQLHWRKANLQHTIAGRSARASRQMKHTLTRHRLALHVRPQVSIAVLESAVLLGSDQKLGMQRIFLRQQKQLVNIGLAIPHTDYRGGRSQLALQSRRTRKTLEPFMALLLFDRSLVAGDSLAELFGITCQDLDIDQAHRRSLGGIGHGVVHENALRAVDMLINRPQPFHVRVSVIVKAGGVLHHQHHGSFLARNSLHGRVIVRGKDGIDLHTLMLKEPIRRFGPSTALTSLRNIGTGLRIEITRHSKKPLAMASITQPDTAKLLFRPVPCWLGWFGARCGQQTRWTRLFAQTLLPVRDQRVEINILDRLFLSVLAVLTTATAALSHVDPVGRPVTRRFKTRRLNIGLQKQGLITIRLRPILWQTFLHPCQHLGSQILHPYPARNDKPRVGHHLGQMILMRSMTPANPALARLQMQSRCTEGQRSQPSLVTADQVTQLRATQRSVSQIVMGGYQLLPLQVQTAILRAHQHQLKPAQLLDRALKLRRHMQSSPSKARWAKAHSAARRWQLDQSALGQTAQRYPAVHRLGPAILSAPAQPLADLPRQFRSRPLRSCAHRRVDTPQHLVRKILSAHHQAGFHLRTDCHKLSLVSSGGSYGT